jgi:hypothetical protein
MPVHENLSAAIPACHAERSEASKLPPDQNTAKPPNTPSNSYAREGKPPSHSPATPHDSGAIIWPGGNSGSQEAGGHSLSVYGEGWGGAGRGAAQLTHTSTVAVSQEHLMMAEPSFGLGEKAAPRKRGDTPSPFTGRAGEGLAEELPNSLTPAQLLFPRTRGNAPLLLPPYAGERKGAVTPSGIHQPATSATPQQLGSPRAQILSRRLGREGGILMALVRSRQASSSLSHVKRSKA